MNYLYGKLNKEVEQNSYKGSTSDTIKIDIDDSTNVISGELVKNYFSFKIYDNLPEATEKTYLTFAVLDDGSTQSLYICLKYNDRYLWKQVASNLRCYYFNDLESTVIAINNNTYPEDNKEQLSSSVVRVITGLAVPIMDILADVTTESDLSISKSCIINLNGHTVTINNDGRLKFINSTGPTEVIINAADAIIQRAGIQSAAKNLITFMGQSLTINGGNFKEYNSRDNAATICSPLAVNCETAKIYIHGARLEAAGRYRGLGTYLYKFSSFEATNSTFVGGALQASASAYSADQTMGIGILTDVNNQLVSSKVKLNMCVCSGECMAANINCELEAVGTTFESCDHGLYVANFANLQFCTLAHKNWANLIAAQLQYPFKDGETKVKTQYSETNAEYANLGLCYISSSDNNATAIMNNCLEQTDSKKNVHIVLSTNYGYKAPSLYLSNHTVLYSIRVDPDRGKGAAKLYVGDNVSLGETVEQFGYVDKSSYRGISFNNEFDVCEGLQNQILQVNEKLAAVDYTYLPKYITGAPFMLHFGRINVPSTEYQIAHLSEVIDPSVVYFVAKDGEETYIQPELITEELKTKYHVQSGQMGNDARYYIPITDELIVLEYYISPTETYYYLHTSADSIELAGEVYVGKAQKLIDDSYASYYNLWSAQKTKEAISTATNAIYGETKVLEGTTAPTRLTVGALGQKYLDTITGRMYLCVEKYTGVAMQLPPALYGWQPLFIPDYQKDNITDWYLPVGHLLYEGADGELCRVSSRRSEGTSYLYGIEMNFIQNSNAPDPGGYFEKDTIGGQLQELGAGKVNRSTGKLKVYATDKDGNTISSISYSIAADANTFPLRDSNGNIRVGTPVEGEDAVPKSYADGKLDKITTTDGYNRAYGVSYEGNQMSFRVANSALASTLAQRDSKGNIKVGTPVEDRDATSKSYVDALKQSTNPNTANTAGHIGQLCLVGQSDFSPYDVYICVMSNPENNTYVWHKMCTTEVPA